MSIIRTVSFDEKSLEQLKDLRENYLFKKPKAQIIREMIQFFYDRRDKIKDGNLETVDELLEEETNEMIADIYSGRQINGDSNE